MFELSEQASPISEGVAEIRIVYTLHAIKPDNTTLESHEDTTSFNSSWRDQGYDPGPPHPSARLPRDTSIGIRGWGMHYPGIHHCRYGGIASVWGWLGSDITPRPTSSRQHRRQHDSGAWSIFPRPAVRLGGSPSIRLSGWRSTTTIDITDLDSRWAIVIRILWDTLPNQLSSFLSCIIFRVNASISTYFQLVNILV
jgi:hypothetical protein